MLIIPELKTVVLQPPRTGTSSLKSAVLDKYEDAFLLYRHMEYAGIPAGYESWRVISQVRNPFTRMESLFQYMSAPKLKANTDPEWLERTKAETRYGFEHWLLHSQYLFANPNPSEFNAFRPRYNVSFPFIEQRKTQAYYTKNADVLLQFEKIESEARRLLAVDIPHLMESERVDVEWTMKAVEHMVNWHAWDVGYYGDSLPLVRGSET